MTNMKISVWFAKSSRNTQITATDPALRLVAPVLSPPSDESQMFLLVVNAKPRWHREMMHRGRVCCQHWMADGYVKRNNWEAASEEPPTSFSTLTEKQRLGVCAERPDILAGRWSPLKIRRERAPNLVSTKREDDGAEGQRDAHRRRRGERRQPNCATLPRDQN